MDKVLEALTAAVKYLGYADIGVEEVMNCLKAILDRVNPDEPKSMAASVEMSSRCQAIVDKACERLNAE